MVVCLNRQHLPPCRARARRSVRAEVSASASRSDTRCIEKESTDTSAHPRPSVSVCVPARGRCSSRCGGEGLRGGLAAARSPNSACHVDPQVDSYLKGQSPSSSCGPPALTAASFPQRENKPLNNVESCLLQEEICGGGGLTRRPTWIFSKTPETAGGPELHPEAVSGEATLPGRPRGLPAALRPHQQPAEEDPP